MRTSVALAGLLPRCAWALRYRWSRVTWTDLMTLALVGFWGGTALLVNRPLQSELKALEANAVSIQFALPAAATTIKGDAGRMAEKPPADSVAAFMAFLPATVAREQQLQTLHGMARESAVELTRVDYMHLGVAHLPGRRTSVQLSLVGGYAAYRTFLHKLFIALPNLAVDRIAMEATPGAPGRMTVRLDASLYYRDDGGLHRP